MIRKTEYIQAFKEAERACEKETVSLITRIGYGFLRLKSDNCWEDFTLYVYDKDSSSATETVISAVTFSDDEKLILMTADGRYIGLKDCHEGSVQYIYQRVYDVCCEVLKSRKEPDFIPKNNNPEIISVRLSKDKTPSAFENKVNELVNDGMDRAGAERWVEDSVFDLEIYYEPECGLFALDPEALECSKCWSPYTQKEITI